MTIEKTHIGIVITKDGPKRKKLHATESMIIAQSFHDLSSPVINFIMLSPSV